MKHDELNLYMQMIENEELVMIKYFVKAKEQSKKAKTTQLLKRYIKSSKDSLQLHAKNIDWLEYYLQQSGVNRVEAIKKRSYWIQQIEFELDHLLICHDEILEG